MRLEWRSVALIAWIGVAGGTLALELLASEAKKSPARAARAAVRNSMRVDDRWSAEIEQRIRDAEPFTKPFDVPTVTSPPARSLEMNSQMGQRLRLAAIAGPPWRAIVTIDGQAGGAITLQIGDSIRGARVARILADSIVLRTAIKSSRYGVGESWAP